MFKQKRYRYVYSLEEIQKVFDIANANSLVYLSKNEYKFENGGENLNAESVVYDTDRYYKITTKFVSENLTKTNDYGCTWIFDKTGNQQNHIHPSLVAKKYAKYYKPYNVVEKNPKLFELTPEGKLLNSAKPIVGYNPKYDKTEHQIVSYDLNSAYASVLMDKIIDTYNMDFFREVKENEVGFLLDTDLTMVHNGFADLVFPLIESPYKEYVKEWYWKKKNSPKDSPERAIAKEILVITVGLWQNKNPFLRAYVVNSCNEFIERLILKYEDKVCMWNTDAIYCTEEIPEINALCGTEIGQFKIEYKGLFRQKGTAYQKVDDGETSYRGIMKMLFKKDFNILTDKLPPNILPYKMNQDTFRIEENKEFQNA